MQKVYIPYTKDSHQRTKRATYPFPVVQHFHTTRAMVVEEAILVLFDDSTVRQFIVSFLLDASERNTPVFWDDLRSRYTTVDTNIRLVV